MADTKRYRVLGGKHVVNTGGVTKGGERPMKIYRKGEIVESKEDLMDAFPGKFELIPDAPRMSSGPAATPRPSPPVQEGEPEETEATGEETEDGDEAGAEAGELGADVTAQFKKAARADLKVFKNKGVYSVADADEPTKPLKDGEDLKDKHAVNAFIGKYLKA